MSFFRQFLVTLAVVLLGGGLWIALDERPGRFLLDSGVPLPEPVRNLIASNLPASGSSSSAPAGARTGARGTSNATVVVADAVTSELTRNRVRAIGTGEAARSVTVYPDVTGIIDNVPVKSGDAVAAGAVLAVLEFDNEQIAVDRARIALDAAEDKLLRALRLQAARTATNVEVIDAQRERDNVRLDLRSAEIALAKRSIVAPFAGRVGIVAVDKGDLVGTQTIIATVDDRSSLKVIFFMPEAFVRELEIGAPVEAVSTASPDRSYAGSITAIDSRLDEASRTLRTEATVANGEDQLRPGMSFTVTLGLEGQRYLSVDPLAVVWERTGPFVWKIAPDLTVGKAKLRIVERNIDRVLVASDEITQGDRVVVEGLQAVRPGAKVEIQNAPRPQAPPGAETETAPAIVPSANATPPGTRREGALGQSPGNVQFANAGETPSARGSPGAAPAAEAAR